ncbi:MAG TPA: DNA replication and repair protein RecF [Candidatus Babeliales bacterium]|jgi:DNA replication and repair protein RecF|nr:DNA replication and repair protein RecF [Candidatus Babeliales bacterium]
MAEQQVSRLLNIHLKQFRCFSNATFILDSPLVYLSGPNGSGKTSLIEALHYACYIRSFRTPTYRELSSHDSNAFFIKLQVQGYDTVDEIQIGLYNEKRLVKINQKRIESYKDLLSYYRAITITADSIKLIQDGPIERRSFLDTALSLHDAQYMPILRQYQATLETRNALLHDPRNCKPDLYTIWTEQLWQKAYEVQIRRALFAKKIAFEVKSLITTYFSDSFAIDITYEPKRMVLGMAYTDFLDYNPSLQVDEFRFNRSLFGAHLDDMIISYKDTNARHFASRGQQKLLVLLIYAAHCRLLGPSLGPTVLLIDDFLTDFDHKRVELLLSLLASLPAQLIITSPTRDQWFENLAKNLCPSTLSLSLD